jgi:hypothetical protein
MKIIACYSIFNESENIIHSLESVKGFCDRIVVLDGAFASYPHKRADGMSDDGTIPLVMDWFLKWSGEGFLAIPKIPWPNQRYKRSCYFRFGDPGDWFFVIDGDEAVESGQEKIRKFLENCVRDGATVKERVYVDEQHRTRMVERFPGLAPRLIRYVPNLRYSESYRKIEQVESVIDWDGFIMAHNRFVRSAERTNIKNEYQTVEAFAARTELRLPDGRSPGFQVRLYRWTPDLRYSGVGRIQYDENWAFDNDGPNSPLVVTLLERHPERSDNSSE